MKATTRNRHAHPTRKILVCALAGCLLLGAAPAFAQSTAATLRGSAAADATITVTNVNTGLSRTTKAGDNGNYNIGGLPPGTYRIDVQAGGQSSSQGVTLAVGQTATLNLEAPAATAAPAGDATTLDAVKVTAPVLVETKTSELATYISQKQIESLPQSSRNFLAFADTVPGMEFEQSADGSTAKLRGGVQSPNNTNVYIDGVGQKNYVLKGGITGQDSSRGNPFPQSAIGEYKVITSNYKAEYDQISSAAVTAVTKSGTNEFHGNFFWDYSTEEWRSARESEKGAGNEKAQSKDEQYGVSFGGPLVKDVAHFFVVYEAKEYQTPQDVSPGQGYLVSDLPSWMQDEVGSTWVPFHEDLYFGKIDWSVNENNLIEFTARRREEDSMGSVGGTNTYSYGNNTQVEETRADLRWQLTAGDWLNDAHLTYEDAYWTVAPANFGNGYVLTDGTADTGAVILSTNAGSGGLQDKGQDGVALQDDLTFSGWDGHTVKMGVKYKNVNLNTTEQQPYNPQYYYDLNSDTETPYYLKFTSGIAGTAAGKVSSKNKQFGIYFQDDWEVNDHLILNLGLRWDYEETPAYLDYVTQQDVIDALNSQDTQTGAPTGQTYAQTLALGGIDISKFISTGSNRKAFKNAWQPRLGFSYDVFADQKFVIFGGLGRAYDRNLFDYFQLEQTKATYPSYSYYINTTDHPCDASTTSNCLEWSESLRDQATLDALVAGNELGGREVWMFQNDLKVPYSDQFSLGVRNVFDLWGRQWNSSVTLQRVEYNDGLLLVRGNRLADGSYFSEVGSPWSGGGVPGLGGLILGINGFESKSNALLVSLDKPYTRSSPWGFNLAYTLTDAKQNIQEQDPEYGWYYPAGGWYSGAYTPRHRLVLSGMVDGPWGTTFSGKLTLASHIRRWNDVWPATPTADNPITLRSYMPDGSIGFKQMDLSATKVWDTGSNIKLRARVDVINVFDWVNWSSYSKNWTTDVITYSGQYQPRTFKLSLGLDW
ncbi:MAG: TonB-dependent receptor [Pseudoxanthomonas sp.]